MRMIKEEGNYESQKVMVSDEGDWPKAQKMIVIKVLPRDAF